MTGFGSIFRDDGNIGKLRINLSNASNPLSKRAVVFAPRTDLVYLEWSVERKGSGDDDGV